MKIEKTILASHYLIAADIKEKTETNAFKFYNAFTNTWDTHPESAAKYLAPLMLAKDLQIAKSAMSKLSTLSDPFPVYLETVISAVESDELLKIVEALKRHQALDKLTEEDKKLLGLIG